LEDVSAKNHEYKDKLSKIQLTIKDIKNLDEITEELRETEKSFDDK
jgi:hypothetical protein